MIYKIKEYKDKLIEKAYKDGMKEFITYFDYNWNFGTPNICILNSRKEINLLKNYKTKGWLIGWADWRTIYILDNRKMKKESSHNKHSKEEYTAFIKHELCHLFYHKISKNYYKPCWLSEGVSIYLSGQLKFRKSITTFKEFIESYEKAENGAYNEGGTVVKILIEKFGKKYLIKLISESRNVENKKEFAKLFKEIYDFDLNYKNFNNLLNKKQ